ncbi:CDGSH iron-sulfur domain-containing protein [Chloroflexi bacterium TSY]|nr:CDGSH iron-sulfur domain-containing protein [Chloroflexi bacterium TSY]
MKNRLKLCVCGRSEQFPLCDGSHIAEDWACSDSSSWAEIGFCASYRFENLAHKLASHYQGVTCLPGDPLPALNTLVMIADGTDLEYPIKVYQQIQAHKRILVSLGGSSHLLGGGSKLGLHF